MHLKILCKKIKGWIKSKNFHLEQVCKRIIENENLYDVITQNQVPTHSKIMLISRRGNNCVLLKSGKLVVVSKCEMTENTNFLITCKVYHNLSALSNYPIDSIKLGIFEVRNLSEDAILKVDESDIIHRYVRLPCKDYFMCFPLLHTIK